MRPLIIAFAVVAMFASSIAFAHGRHGGSHTASFEKSGTRPRSGDLANSNLSESKSDGKPGSDVTVTGVDPDAGKTPQHKPGRAQDEEEVMQAEH
jgi:hypothetical protein